MNVLEIVTNSHYTINKNDYEESDRIIFDKDLQAPLVSIVGKLRNIPILEDAYEDIFWLKILSELLFYQESLSKDNFLVTLYATPEYFPLFEELIGEAEKKFNKVNENLIKNLNDINFKIICDELVEFNNLNLQKMFYIDISDIGILKDCKAEKLMYLIDTKDKVYYLNDNIKKILEDFVLSNVSELLMLSIYNNFDSDNDSFVKKENTFTFSKENKKLIINNYDKVALINLARG